MKLRTVGRIIDGVIAAGSWVTWVFILTDGVSTAENTGAMLGAISATVIFGSRAFREEK